MVRELNSSDIRIAVNGRIPRSSPLARKHEKSASPVTAKLKSWTGTSSAMIHGFTSGRLRAASTTVGHAAATIPATRQRAIPLIQNLGERAQPALT